MTFPTSVIEVRQVDKLFQTPEGPFFALREVNVAVASAEIFGIIGRSGAGKSTLLRILNLLERPTAGEVFIEGREINRLSEPDLRQLRQRIGMIFQHFNLLSSRTVYENVRLPLRIAGGLSSKEEAARVAEALELVGLTGQTAKYPRQLSGGQRQRVGIARALANRPRLLLCDEATSALDPETTQSILALLRDINQRLKLTIVLITHGMDVIRAIADRVAVLDHGRIVESGEVLDVFLSPRHPTTRSLLAEIGLAAPGSGGPDHDGPDHDAPDHDGADHDGADRGGPDRDGPDRDAPDHDRPNSDPGIGVPADAHESASSGSRIWRLTYRGALVATPILTATAREHGLDITILQGSIGRIKDTPFAQLTVTVASDDGPRLASFSNALTQRGVQCEQLS